MVSTRQEAVKVLDDGVVDLLMSDLRRDDSEQFSLPVGIESPRVVEQSEEGVPVELLPDPLGMVPLLVEDLGLFAQVDIVIQGIVVKISVWDPLSARLGLVRLVEDVHNLDNALDHPLVNESLIDDDRDVALELDHNAGHHLLTDDIRGNVMHHLLSAFILPEECIAGVKQEDEPFKDPVEVGVLHFSELEQHDEAPNGGDHELQVGLGFLVYLRLDDFEQDGKSFCDPVFSFVHIFVLVSHLVQEGSERLEINGTLRNWLLGVSLRLVHKATTELVEVLKDVIQLLKWEAVEVLLLHRLNI